MDRHLRICCLLLFCEALAAACIPNERCAALGDVWRADRRVAGHYRQLAGFCGSGLDRTSESTRPAARLGGLIPALARANAAALRAGTVFAYNAASFSVLWRPWTKHSVLKIKILNRPKAVTGA